MAGPVSPPAGSAGRASLRPPPAQRSPRVESQVGFLRFAAVALMAMGIEERTNLRFEKLDLLVSKRRLIVRNGRRFFGKNLVVGKCQTSRHQDGRQRYAR
jgi:hypothetical protein